MNTIKSRKKRLFLFAGYDAHGLVDAAEIMYVRALARLGDVVYVMDSDAPRAELKKVSDIPGVIYAAAARHGEYDFGSYKRAFEYAADKGLLNDYDFVYMVNDSVYGPVFDIAPLMDRMEDAGTDAFGPVIHPDSAGVYIQSWFIGMRPVVFNSEWFREFILSVKNQDSKGTVIALYERGFTRQLIRRGLSFYGVWTCPGRAIYNRVKYLFRHGMPFIKRNAFNRRSGALGRQLTYVLGHIDADARNAIVGNVTRVLGAEHVKWLLTRNPLRIAYRNIAHCMKKVFIEGI